MYIFENQLLLIFTALKYYFSIFHSLQTGNFQFTFVAPSKPQHNEPFHTGRGLGSAQIFLSQALAEPAV